MCFRVSEHWKTKSVSVQLLCFLFLLLFNTLYYSFREMLGRLTWVRLQQPQVCSATQSYKYNAGFVRVSVINGTLTWTTGSLTRVRTWSFLCVRMHTHGCWAHRQRVRTAFLTRKNSLFFLVFLTGFEPRVYGSRVPRSTSWITPSCWQME